MNRSAIMKNIVVIILLSSSLMSSNLSAQTVVNFDDLPTTVITIPAGYNDWNWSSGISGNLSSTYGGGYTPGTTSSPNAAFNSSGNYPWSISYVGSAECVNVTSISMNAAWNNDLEINLEAFKDGTSKYSVNQTLDATTAANTFDPEFIDIDSISITLINAGTNAGLGVSGEHITIDDFTFTTSCASSAAAIPTLGEWGLILLALSLMGLGIVGVRSRYTASV